MEVSKWGVGFPPNPLKISTAKNKDYKFVAKALADKICETTGNIFQVSWRQKGRKNSFGFRKVAGSPVGERSPVGTVFLQEFW